MEKQEILMRSLILTTVAAALATAVLSLPAQASSVRHSWRHLPQFNDDTYGDAGSVSGSRSYGYGTGPYWQGEPTDNLPIWRYGYYQGTDSDPFIRSQLMRDPTNH
jgi:hypothetical protein